MKCFEHRLGGRRQEAGGRSFLFPVSCLLSGLYWLNQVLKSQGFADNPSFCSDNQSLSGDDQSLSGDDQSLSGDDQSLSGDDQSLSGDARQPFGASHSRVGGRKNIVFYQKPARLNTFRPIRPLFGVLPVIFAFLVPS